MREDVSQTGQVMRDRTTKKCRFIFVPFRILGIFKPNYATRVHMLQNQGFSNKTKTVGKLFPHELWNMKANSNKQRRD